MGNVKLLMIEDVEDDALLLVEKLRESGLDVSFLRVETQEELVKALQQEQWDVVISDYTLPRMSALDALKLTKESNPDLPFIVISGKMDEESIVIAMKSGADDYFVKGKLLRLPKAIRRELWKRQIAIEQKQADEKLKESETRFKILADSAPVLMWMADPEGSCYFVNEGWLQFTGRCLEEEMGYGWTQNVHHDDLAQCLQIYRTAVRQRLEYQLEFRLRRRDGDFRWVLNKVKPYYGHNGSFAGFVGSCVDISDRKLAEAEREGLLHREKMARLEAERLSQLKDEFLATLSHELRTPMNAITGWAELLDQGLIGPEDYKQAFSIIHKNAVAENRLISDILDVSTIITGKLEMRLQALNVPNIVRYAMESVRLSAEAKRISLVLHEEMDIGPVAGDPTRLQQAIWNLLVNAIKYSPRDGRIEIIVRRNRSAVEIEVKDNGEGIDPGFMPYVFDRFTQSDQSLQRKHGGLGIGLALVKHIAELHGGRVGAQSEGKGLGATFTLTLPVMAVGMTSHKGSANERRELKDKQRNGVLNGLSVLVVDDQDDAVILLKYLLQQHGANVITASSAEEAFTHLLKKQPDLLLSDIAMPGEDGYDLIQKVRSLGNEKSRIPAVALTAHVHEEEKKQALRSGFQEHLAKPVDASKLVATVARLTGRVVH